MINAARHEGSPEAVTLAHALFCKMPPAARVHQTYTVMIRALARAGRGAEAVALLDESAAHGLRPLSFPSY